MSSRFENLNERVKFLEELTAQLLIALEQAAIPLKKETGIGKDKVVVYDLTNLLTKSYKYSYEGDELIGKD